MQYFNYHTHTYRCGHADNSMSDEDYVKEFIKKGFKKIAFTDHCPQREMIDTRLYMRMEYSQANEYIDSINALKRRYDGVIGIETGFEIEYLPGQEANLFELKSMADKIILGQHFIYNDDKSDLKVLRVDTFNDSDLIKYANYIKTAMELGLVDIVAHPDLFMLSSTRFGNAEKEASEIICKASRKTGIPLEINLGELAFCTSSTISTVHYPCREFWEIASRYNVNVIYGIDAHGRTQIERFENSVRLANEIIGRGALDGLNFLTDL